MRETRIVRLPRGPRRASAPLGRTLVAALALISTIPAPAASKQHGPWPFTPAGLSRDRFPAATVSTVEKIPAHDGVLLHAEVYRPDTSSQPDWRTPVILVDSPYSNGTFNEMNSVQPERFSGSAAAPTLMSYFTPKGYTVVLADIRGFGNSGGCSDLDGPTQAQDFKTLVEYFAAQPWSSGRVGSFGVSFNAEAANGGAVLQPSGLVTMVTVAGLSGLYDLYAFDGVPYGAYSLRPAAEGGGVGGAAFYAAVSMDPPTDRSRLPYVERSECQPAHLVANADSSGDLSNWFLEREFRRGVDNVKASVLYVQGFGDTSVLPINIDGWYDELPTFKRAIFGQWGHARPDADTPWTRTDWIDTVHAWFDRWLLSLPTGVEKWPAVQVQDERRVWRAEDSFAGLGVAHDHPLGQGSLGTPAAAGTTSQFTETTTAVWSSPPVDSAGGLHLSGQAVLDAQITLDQPDAHFVLTIEEVTEKGDAKRLTYGYLSAPHRTLSEDPSRGSMHPAATPTVGVPAVYRIRTMPFDRWVAEGSTIRLVLTGVDADTYPAGSAFTADVAVDGSSILRLPVVERECGLLVQQPDEPERPIPPCHPRDRR